MKAFVYTFWTAYLALVIWFLVIPVFHVPAEPEPKPWTIQEQIDLTERLLEVSLLNQEIMAMFDMTVPGLDEQIAADRAKLVKLRLERAMNENTTQR